MKQFDDVLYTPYSYDGPHATSSASASAFLPDKPVVGDLLGAADIPVSNDGIAMPNDEMLAAADNVELPSRPRRRRVKKRFDKLGGEHSGIPEVFVFEFGTVVCWGMTEIQEKRFLSSM